MTKRKLTKPQIRQRAEEIVEKLLSDHDMVVLGFVRQILAEKVPKPLGRRVDPNWSIYKDMARELRSGRIQHVSAAGAEFAPRVEGVSEKTAADTLRKTYPKYKEALYEELDAEEAAARKGEPSVEAILDRALSADLETWDL